jgi:diketogulonate reductase-like aldo/keto reductase
MEDGCGYAPLRKHPSQIAGDRQPELFTIPKASSPEYVAENARAGDIRLTEAEIQEIDRAFPLGRPRVLPTL